MRHDGGRFAYVLLVHAVVIGMTLLGQIAATLSGPLRSDEARSERPQATDQDEETSRLGGTTFEGRSPANLGLKWRTVPPSSGAPPYGFSKHLLYEESLGKVVLFPGWEYVSSELWVLDDPFDSKWRQLAVSGSIAQSPVSLLAHAPGGGQVVLLNGAAGGSGVTWVFHFANLTWERVSTSVVPIVNYEAGLEYAGDSTFVLYVPVGGGVLIEKTWLFSLENRTWWRVYPASMPAPSVRRIFSTAFVATREQAAFFSDDLYGAAVEELWMFHLPNLSWTKTPVNPPPGEPPGQIEFVPITDRILLHTGRATWTFDLTKQDWTRANTGRDPGSSYGQGLAYLPTLEKVVEYGGKCNEGCTGWVWLFDPRAEAWEEGAPPPWPPGRADHTLALDAKRGKVLLFGGEKSFVSGGWGPDAESWIFDPETDLWEQLDLPTRPSIRSAHAMAYHPGTDSFYLFGGRNYSLLLSDTWKFDAGSRQWVNVSPPVSPTPRFGHVMAYSSAIDRIIMHGGQANRAALGDTWVFNPYSNEWNRTNPGLPSLPRFSHAMVEDPKSGVLVTFGGCADWEYCGLPKDVWVFASTTMAWERLDTTGNPEGRTELAMAYHSDVGKVVVYGGRRGDPLGDLWFLDLSMKRWIQELSGIRGSESLSASAGMVYLHQQAALMINGGWVRYMGERLSGSTLIGEGRPGVGIPAVILTDPIAGAKDVDVNTSIRIEFNQVMEDASSERATSISPPPQTIASTLVDGTLTLDPEGPLAYATTYVVTVSKSATSFFGDPMTGDFIFSFTTMAKEAPRPPPLPQVPPDPASIVSLAIPYSLIAAVTIGFLVAFIIRRRQIHPEKERGGEELEAAPDEGGSVGRGSTGMQGLTKEEILQELGVLKRRVEQLEEALKGREGK
jgi:hypothetical protein